MDVLKAYLAEHSPQLRQVLEEFFTAKRASAKRLTPHLVQSLDVLSEFTFRGGKQLRPMLTLLAFQLAGGQLTPAVYQVAAAVEVFHKHILNLDDMADRDEVRYGGPTIWKKYQEIFADWKDTTHHARSFSEMDGTLLGSFAFELVQSAEVSAEQRLAILEVFIQQMYFETIAGWQIHYYQNQQLLSEASEEEFIKGLDLVTARYTFVGPLKIGLLLANAMQTPLAKTVEQYGLDVGLAFQVTDDILGLFGDPAETGKAVGNDVREGKKTLLLQQAYHKADQAEKGFLIDVCGRDLTQSELNQVQAIVRQTGALADSEQLALDKVTGAQAVLSKLKVSPGSSAHSAQQVLLALAQFVAGRKK